MVFPEFTLGLLQGVKVTGVIEYKSTYSKTDFKWTLENEQIRKWNDKQMCGKFLSDIPLTDRDETWKQLRISDLTLQTKALIFAAQEQALKTNWVKQNIGKTALLSLHGFCGIHIETVNHIVSGCEKLAQTEYLHESATQQRSKDSTIESMSEAWIKQK